MDEMGHSRHSNGFGYRITKGLEVLRIICTQYRTGMALEASILQVKGLDYASGMEY